MFEEARVFRGEHGLDQVRRNLFKRNGVVLADAALADHLAIGVREGDGIFAAPVPHVTFGKLRHGIGQNGEGGDGAEGRRVIGHVDNPALWAG